MRKALKTLVGLSRDEWEEMARFWVAGIPVTQGSMRRGKNGQIFHVNNKLLNQWRTQIHKAYIQNQIKTQYDGPIGLRIAFRLPRPTFAKDRYLPHRRHSKNGDIDKLTRAVLDALTTTRTLPALFKDDVRVCALAVEKTYADPYRELGDRVGCDIAIYKPLEHE